MSQEIIVDLARLRRFTKAALERVGVSHDEAIIGADALIEADLRGIETHGVEFLPVYCKRFEQGGLNPRPNIQIVREGPTTALMDGDAGMGHIISVKAMNLAIEKAGVSGVGVVAVRNSNHFGMAAYYSMMALPRDMIGFCTSHGGRTLAAWGGRDPVVGNNPQSFAIPAGEELPIVLDMSHSVVAGGKIRFAARRGQKIPLGWGLDEEGNPTDDPNKVFESKWFLPFGGHKGFGLAVVMEILAGILSGAFVGATSPRDVLHKDAARPSGSGHLFQAIDVQQFTPVNEFKEKVDYLVRLIKGSKLAPGFDRIYVPGEIEFLAKEKSLKEGLQMHISVYQELRQLADHLGLEFAL